MLYRERLPARQGNAELVLLHGWGASSDCWRSALPQLRRQFNVTLIDLPGHGRSQSHRVSSVDEFIAEIMTCLLYTSPSPRDERGSRMPSSA